MNENSLSIQKLEQIINAKTKQKLHQSYTQEMLGKGNIACIRKFAEEALELVIAATENHPQKRNNILNETADVIYHLLLVLKINDIKLCEIENILAKRNLKSSQKDA